MIRMATGGDLPSILAIYNEVIATTRAIWTDENLTIEDRTAWFEGRRRQNYPVLVATESEDILGFSSFGDFRTFPSGYRFTVEHTVHVRADRRGHGIGTRLVEALIPIAEAMGKHVMIGAVDASNEGSIRLHERLGFWKVGHLSEVGIKSGEWLDLVFLQRMLRS